MKASCEDFQKPDPTMAVMMKAFLLMYLMIFSRKKKHPLSDQRMPLMQLLVDVALWTLSLMYSTMSLNICTTARMNDPQATVPR